MSEFLLYTEITGRDLKNLNLCKILHNDQIHNDFQYQEGLNIDSIKFNPNGNCSSGGLYFCRFEDFPLYIGYGTKIARITLPDDARVYVEQNKFKADKIILSDIREIKDMKEWNDFKFCNETVNRNRYALQYVINQTPEICLAAVQQNGYTLQYVKEPTPEIYLEAVRENGLALQFIYNQTSEICLAAVQQNGLALQFVKKQNPKIIQAAIYQNKLSFNYAILTFNFIE